MANHTDFGRLAEDRAVDYLHKKGYLILERNFRYLKAEIDIIAEFKGEIIIVEVKARNSDYFSNPEEAVNMKKRKLLILASNYYIESKGLNVEVRFDIITFITKNKVLEIKHIENAFDSIH